MLTERAQASLLLVVTARLWSSGGLAIKLVDVGPMAITGVRSALSALMPGLLLRGSLGLRPTSALLGAAKSYAFLLLRNVAATKMTTSGNATRSATYTAPVYVALLAPRLLGEPTRARLAVRPGRAVRNVPTMMLSLAGVTNF